MSLREAAQRVAAGNAGLPAERLEYRIGTGERARVAVRRTRGSRSPTRLDGGDRFARGARFGRRAGEACRILYPLEIKAEGGHAGVVAEDFDEFLDR